MSPGNLARAITYVTRAILDEMETIVADEWYESGARDEAVEKLSLDLADIMVKLVEE